MEQSGLVLEIKGKLIFRSEYGTQNISDSFMNLTFCYWILKKQVTLFLDIKDALEPQIPFPPFQFRVQLDWFR